MGAVRDEGSEIQHIEEINTNRDLYEILCRNEQN